MAEVRTVAVIGAGGSGAAIAFASALAGYRTILEDILPSSLKRAQHELNASMNGNEQTLGRIEYASSIEDAARQADLVIEAVPDEAESKLEIFTLLDKICKPKTIVALTGSSMSVSDVASITCRPQNCVGMRFSYSAGGVDGLELVRSAATDEITGAVCLLVARRMARHVSVIDEAEAEAEQPGNASQRNL